MDARTQLKSEICNYFLGAGASREALPAAIKAFKLCADEGREFEDFFAERHHQILKGFQRRYWDLDESPLCVPHPQKMTKDDAEMIFADPQSSRSLLEEAARVLGY